MNALDLRDSSLEQKRQRHSRNVEYSIAGCVVRQMNDERSNAEY